MFTFWFGVFCGSIVTFIISLIVIIIILSKSSVDDTLSNNQAKVITDDSETANVKESPLNTTQKQSLLTLITTYSNTNVFGINEKTENTILKYPSEEKELVFNKQLEDTFVNASTFARERQTNITKLSNFITELGQIQFHTAQKYELLSKSAEKYVPIKDDNFIDR